MPITNEKCYILDVIPDGPTIKFLARLEILSQETTLTVKDAIQEYMANFQIPRLPPSQITVGTRALVYFVNANNIPEFHRVQVVDNKNWDNGSVSVLLVDDCRWNCQVELTRLCCCPPHIEEFPITSEVFVLADVAPALHANSWSDHAVNFLRSQLIGMDVHGTVYREHGSLALFRPYDHTEQGQLLAKTMAQCGMAYISPSFPGLAPFSSPSSGFLPSRLAPKSFLYLPEPRRTNLPLSTTLPNLCSLSSSNSLSQSPKADYCKQSLLEGEHKSLKTGTGARYFAIESELGRQDDCMVAYIANGPWKFYIRTKNQIELCQGLYEKLSIVVAKNSFIPFSPSDPGVPLLCKSHKLNEYCRGLFLEVVHGKISVFLVDIGTVEELPSHQVWILPPELQKIPILIVPCRLQGLPSSINQQISRNFEQLFANQSVSVIFEKIAPDLVVNVSLEVGTLSALKLITNKAFDCCSIITDEPLILSHISGNLLYFQSSKSQDLLNTFQRTLQQHSSLLGPVTHPAAGQPCLATFSEDMNWYRALILDVQNGIKVRFIDYGNEELLSTAESLKEIDSTLISHLTSQATPCLLEGLEDKNFNEDGIFNWLAEEDLIVTSFTLVTREMDGIPTSLQTIQAVTNTSRRSLNEFLSQKTENIQISLKDESCLQVAPDSDLSSADPFPEVPIVPDLLKLCRVTHVDSQSHFYVTLLQNEMDIKVISKTLANCFYDISSDLDSSLSFVRGDHLMVRCKTSSGDAFHRAILDSTSLHFIKVKLVDMGTEHVSTNSEVKRLPQEASSKRFPAQAIECSLETPLVSVSNASFESTVTREPVYVHFLRKEADTWQVSILKITPLSYDDEVSEEREVGCLENPDTPRQNESEEDVEMIEEESFRISYSSPSVGPTMPVESRGTFRENPRGKSSDPATIVTIEDVLGRGKDRVLPLQPPLSPLETVFISYYDEASNITWVQRKSDSSLLLELNVQLDQEMSSQTLKDPSAGMLCLCQSIEDGLMYRSQILSTEGADLVVHFVDYGNTEKLPRSKVKELSASLLKAHNLCYSCIMKSPTDAESLIDQEITVKLLGKEGNNNIIELMEVLENPANTSGDSQTHPENEALSNEENIIPNLESTTETELLSNYENIIQSLEPPTDIELELLITHVDDNSTLSLQLCSNICVLDELQQKLLSLVDTAENFKGSQNRTYCVARYSLDGLWYRAKVLLEDSKKEEAVVTFIDYGNIETFRFDELKVLPKSCFSLSAQSFRCNIYSDDLVCILKGKEIKSQLESVVESLITGLVQKDETCGYILMNSFIDGESLESKLMEKPDAIESEINFNDDESSVCDIADVKKVLDFPGENLPVSQDLTGESISLSLEPASTNTAGETNVKQKFFITCKENDKIIWVQDFNQSQLLDELSQNIEAYMENEAHEPLGEAAIGTFVISKFPVDGAWYRAEILDRIDDGTVDVHYIDFGNDCRVAKNDIYTLPTQLSILPPQAFLCSLELSEKEVIRESLDVIEYLISVESFEAQVSSTTDGCKVLTNLTVDHIALEDVMRKLVSPNEDEVCNVARDAEFEVDAALTDDLSEPFDRDKGNINDGFASLIKDGMHDSSVGEIPQTGQPDTLKQDVPCEQGNGEISTSLPGVNVIEKDPLSKVNDPGIYYSSTVGDLNQCNAEQFDERIPAMASSDRSHFSGEEFDHIGKAELDCIVPYSKASDIDCEINDLAPIKLEKSIYEEKIGGERLDAVFSQTLICEEKDKNSFYNVDSFSTTQPTYENSKINILKIGTENFEKECSQEEQRCHQKEILSTDNCQLYFSLVETVHRDKIEVNHKRTLTSDETPKLNCKKNIPYTTLNYVSHFHEEGNIENQANVSVSHPESKGLQTSDLNCKTTLSGSVISDISPPNNISGMVKEGLLPDNENTDVEREWTVCNPVSEIPLTDCYKSVKETLYSYFNLKSESQLSIEYTSKNESLHTLDSNSDIDKLHIVESTYESESVYTEPHSENETLRAEWSDAEKENLNAKHIRDIAFETLLIKPNPVCDTLPTELNSANENLNAELNPEREALTKEPNSENETKTEEPNPASETATEHHNLEIETLNAELIPRRATLFSAEASPESETLKAEPNFGCHTLTTHPNYAKETLNAERICESEALTTERNSECEIRTAEESNSGTEIPTAEPNSETEIPTAEPNYETEIPTAEPNLEIEIPTAGANYEIELPTAEANSETEIQTAEPKYETEIQTVEPNYDTEIPTAEPNYDTEILTAEANSETEIKSAKPNYDTEIPTTEPNYETEIRTSEANYETEIKTAEPKYDTEIPTAEANYDTEISTAEANSETEIATAEENSETEIPTAEPNSETEIPTAEPNYGTEIPTVEANYETDIKTAEPNYDTEIPNAETNSDTENPIAEPSSETEIPTEEANYKTEIPAAEANYETEIKTGEPNYVTEIKTVEPHSEMEIPIAEPSSKNEITTAEPYSEIEITTAEPNSQIEILTAQLNSDTEFVNAEANSETEIPTAEANSETEIPKAEANSETEIPKAEANSETEIPTAEPNFETDIKSAKPNSETQITTTEPNYEIEIPTAEANYETEIPTAEPNYDTEIPTAETNYDTQIPNAEANSVTEIPIAEPNYETGIPTAEPNYETEIPTVEANYKTEIPTVEANYETEIPKVEANSETEIPTAEPNFETDIKSAKPNSEMEITTTEPNYEIEIPTAEANYETEIPTAEPNYDTEIPTAEANYDIEIPNAEANSVTEIPIAEPNYETGIPTAEPNYDTEIPNAETENQIAEPSPDTKITTTEPNSEIEITTAEANSETEFPTAEANSETEIPIVEPNYENEITTAEPHSETEIKTAEPNSETKISTAQLNYETEFPTAVANPEIKIPTAEANSETEIPTANLNSETEIPTAEQNYETEIPTAEQNYETEIPTVEANYETDIKTAEPNYDTEIPNAEPNSETENPIAEFSSDTEIPIVDLNYENKILTAEPNYETQIPTAEANSETEIPSAEANSETEIPSAEANSETEIPSAEANSETEIPSAEANSETEIPTAEANYETEIPTAEANSEIEIKTAKPNYDSEIPSAEPHSETEITIAEPSSETEITTAEPNYEIEIPTAQLNYETEFATAEANSETEIPTAEANSETEIPTAEANFETEIPTAEANFETEIPTAEANFETEIPTAEANFETEIPSAEANFETEIPSAEANFETQIPTAEPNSETEIRTTEPNSEMEIQIAEPNSETEIPPAETNSENEIPTAESNFGTEITIAEPNLETEITTAELNYEPGIPTAQPDLETLIPTAEPNYETEIQFSQPSSEIEILTSEPNSAKTKIQTAESNSDIEFKSAESNSDIEFNSAESNSDIEFNSAESNGEIEFKSAEPNGEIEFKSAEPNYETEIQNAESNFEIEIQSVELNSVIEIQLAEPHSKILIQPLETTYEIEIHPKEPQSEFQFRFAELNSEIKIQPAKSQSKISSIQPADANSEIEFLTAEPHFVVGFLTAEPNSEIEFQSAEPNSETENQPIELNSKIEIQPIEPHSDILTHSAEPNSEIEIPKSEIEIPPAEPNFKIENHHTKPNSVTEINPPEPNYETEIYPAVPNFEMEIYSAEPNFEIKVHPAESIGTKIQSAEPISKTEIKSEETYGTEIQLSQPNSETQIQPPEANSEAEIQSPERDSKTKIQPPERNSETEIQPAQPNFETEIQPSEPNSETKIQPAESNSETEIQPVHSNYETEIHPAEPNSKSETLPIEPDQESETLNAIQIPGRDTLRTEPSSANLSEVSFSRERCVKRDESEALITEPNFLSEIQPIDVILTNQLETNITRTSCDLSGDRINAIDLDLFEIKDDLQSQLAQDVCELSFHKETALMEFLDPDCVTALQVFDVSQINKACRIEQLPLDREIESSKREAQHHKAGFSERSICCLQNGNTESEVKNTLTRISCVKLTLENEENFQQNLFARPGFDLETVNQEISKVSHQLAKAECSEKKLRINHHQPTKEKDSLISYEQSDEKDLWEVSFSRERDVKRDSLEDVLSAFKRLSFDLKKDKGETIEKNVLVNQVKCSPTSIHTNLLMPVEETLSPATEPKGKNSSKESAVLPGTIEWFNQNKAADELYKNSQTKSLNPIMMEEAPIIDKNVNEDFDFRSLISIGRVVHVADNPVILWIQNNNDNKQIEIIKLSLKEAIQSGLKKLSEIKVGKVCCSFFFGDLIRAKILNVNSNTARLHFLDTGNKSCISIENIFECPLSIAGLPSTAKPFLLPVHMNAKNNSKVVSLIKPCCYKANCSFIELTSYLRSPFKKEFPYAEIATPSGNLAALLVNAKLASPFTQRELIHNDLIKEFRNIIEVFP